MKLPERITRYVHTPLGRDILRPPAEVGACVVLLHGLARSARSLAPLGLALEAAGYRVINHGYASTSLAPEALAAEAEHAMAEAEGRPVHVVTHSMGGIVLRAALAARPSLPEALRRVVMIGPPNQGSELVDHLGGLAPFRWVNGPAGLALGTGPDSLPRRLPPVSFDLGVIAGSRSVSPWFSALLPSPNDGKVSVESTRVEGMRDHITLPVTHTWALVNPEVIRQVLFYLAEGHFDHARSSMDLARAAFGR